MSEYKFKEQETSLNDETRVIEVVKQVEVKETFTIADVKREIADCNRQKEYLDERIATLQDKIDSAVESLSLIVK